MEQYRLFRNSCPEVFSPPEQTPAQASFLWIFKNFKDNFFTEHFWVTASVYFLTLERKTGCMKINVAAAIRSEVPMSETVNPNPSVKQ